LELQLKTERRQGSENKGVSTAQVNSV
jgi:hypothetical protein